MIANQAGTTVWKWDQQEPFGSTPPNDNPSGLGAFDFPLRFPGQYFDRETGLHYNMASDYDPAIGGYEESDPIGLEGGLNTYAYGVGSPLVYVDPEGLAVSLICRPVAGFPTRDHCFVHVTCPEKGINEVLSLFGSFPYLGFATGYAVGQQLRNDRPAQSGGWRRQSAISRGGRKMRPVGCAIRGLPRAFA